jgi:GntR family transcriptional regulator
VSIESPPPAYLQVARQIREAIAAGEFPPGAKLPAEPELAERYGVSRALVNRALGILQSEGLVKPQRGRGTFVNEIPVIRRDTAARQRRAIREAGQARGAFDAELAAKGLTPSTTVTVGRAPASAEVAALLDVNEGAEVVSRSRVMSANDVPVQIAMSFLPLDIAQGTPLEEEDTGPGGTYSRLADLGHAPVEFTETVRVRAPEPDEARTLKMELEQRILSITRTARTSGGRIVEVNKITLPAHQWELSFTWSAE